METNFVTTVFLSIVLFIVMLSMGLGLTINDFKQILVEPKAMVLGLLAQLIMLPVVGFLLANLFPLSSELAVGLMVLVACPGGPTSNIITCFMRGNVALSITLTAVSSLISIFTIPLVVNLAMRSFMGQAIALQLPFLKTVIQISGITLVPVILGMVIHHYAPHFAAKVERWAKWLSLFFLTLITVGLIKKEQTNITSFLLQVGWVTLALNVVTMTLGFALSILAKLDACSTKSITVEVGIQNSTLAITIAGASTFLNTPNMAIPAATYSIIMSITGVVFAGLVRYPRVAQKLGLLRTASN